VALRLSDRARRDIDDILAYSLDHYGRDTADRYGLLLTTALQAVGRAPQILGSGFVNRMPGVRTYSIAHSRLRTPGERRVRQPVHKLVYRLANDGVVEILAVVGDNYPPARVL
jgi:toxin ParE1/3/4